MGNCSSEHHQHHARMFRTENFTNDPSAFRVFVKKRNKFIPGWLKINDDEIVFSRSANNFQFWPLAHLRRYGYTCSGVFFFESGRRCATGEGLHTFQSHQAERIFHMVQSKIKIEEYARGSGACSRAGSVASGHHQRVNSLVPQPGAAARIHPVQRFSSEGATNNEFPDSASQQGASSGAPRGLAPPPYSAYQEARRAQQNPSPNCPSVISAASATGYARAGAGSVIGAPCTSNGVTRDRPRSVVSNIEHGLVQQQHRPYNYHGLPMARLPQQHPAPLQHTNNASSATLLQQMLQRQHQQQQQQQGGFALPPSMLAASASGSCLMNQSFHSALDSAGTGGGNSPWASQQQLEGEIVLEHVLGAENRRRLARQQNGGAAGGAGAPAEPIRVAVPPPRPAEPPISITQQQMCMMRPEDADARHAYVNVDLTDGADPQLNVRELHRTDRTRRLEFLSTGPGAFMLASPSSGASASGFGPSIDGMPPMLCAYNAATTALPPALMHQSFHQFYGTGAASPAAASAFPPQMSASISGALPPDPTHQLMMGRQLQQQQQQLFGNGGAFAVSNSLDQLQQPMAMLGAQLGAVHQQQQQLLMNTSSCSNSTLLGASSTNTATTNASSAAAGGGGN